MREQPNGFVVVILTFAVTVGALVTMAALSSGCGRPFLRCSELEVGASVDAGADQ